MKTREEGKKEVEMSVSDYELIYLFTQGDEEALEVLMQRYKKLTMYYINRYQVLFPKFLEKHEMYQISLVSLYNAVLTFNEKKDNTFATYYCVILEHDVLMHIRYLRKGSNQCHLHAVSLDQSINESEGLYLIDTLENQQEEYAPEKFVDTRQIHARIEATLCTYTAQEQHVFRLWMNGYTYPEIMAHVGMKRKQVEYTILRIKKDLQVELRDWK